MLDVQVPSVAEIEVAAERRRLSISRLCRLADVDGTTLWRWRQRGSIPTVPTLKRLVDTLLSYPVLTCDECTTAPDCLRQQRCAEGRALPAPTIPTTKVA